MLFKRILTTSMEVSPQIEESWKSLLMDEFQSDYFKKLKEFLLEEKKNNKTIYPPGNFIFNAFNRTPVERVKVIIIGQDPYHGEGQAHGLCFSVQKGIKKPPSLENIFKELQSDLNILAPSHGNLEHWADQGVLLLNATLTVRANQAGSHQNKGWEIFTNAVIQKLSNEKNILVFLLWGRYAQAKEEIIDTSKHYILKAAHPSPFSATNGFFGSNHFSKTNQILKLNGLDPIDWLIPE